MTSIFVDTSFYLAVLSPLDALHQCDVHWSRESPRPHVTTDCILWELGNTLSRGIDRILFITFAAALRDDPSTRIVPADRDLLDRSLAMFSQRPDKTWSLTDCASFVVMIDLGLTDSLTADHHFEQAGFRTLLRPEPAE